MKLYLLIYRFTKYVIHSIYTVTFYIIGSHVIHVHVIVYSKRTLAKLLADVTCNLDEICILIKECCTQDNRLDRLDIFWYISI